MAKKKKKDKDNAVNEELDNNEVQQEVEEEIEPKPKREKSGKLKKLLSLLLMLIFIGSLVGYIIMFNGFGLRDGLLRPVLEKIPVVSDSLPPVNASEITMGNLVLENEQLKSENEILKQQIESSDGLAADSVAEIERLKLIEQQQTEFVQMKEEFDTNFAKMTSEDYIKYYEQMYPDLAQQVYGELISDKYNQEELDEYIATFQTMEADGIASIFEEMMTTDIELVVLIMENIDNQLAGETLAAMEPANAAQIAKLMSPNVR